MSRTRKQLAVALGAVALAACGVLPDNGEVRCRRDDADGGCSTHVVCHSACPTGETEVDLDGGAPGCFNPIGGCLQ